MGSLGIQCVFCLRLRKSAEGAGRGTTAVYLNNQLEPVHACTTSRCCLLYCSTSERVATGWLKSNPLFSSQFSAWSQVLMVAGRERLGWP